MGNHLNDDRIVEKSTHNGPLQPWVTRLTIMQSSVLLGAIRGPDGQPKYGPHKMLMRWYRRCVLISAMDKRILHTPFEKGGGSFTGPSYDGTGPARHGLDWRTSMDGIVGDYLASLDAIPHHFAMHLMHAIQIVGYKHPDGIIRAWWCGVYLRLVHDMHLWPETESQMDDRLGDEYSGWLKRADVATRD